MLSCSVRFSAPSFWMGGGLENWTHVYMNLFTRNNSFYHLVKYLLFLLKHPVYVYIIRGIVRTTTS